MLCELEDTVGGGNAPRHRQLKPVLYRNEAREDAHDRARAQEHEEHPRVEGDPWPLVCVDVGDALPLAGVDCRGAGAGCAGCR